MKIFEYTFRTPKLSVEDGKLVENGTIEKTCTFTLLHKGFGLYEELAGKPLMAALIDLDGEDTIDKMISKDFVSNLACASYVKIADNTFHNNRATAEEFRKSPVFSKAIEDVRFIKELIHMALDCVNDSNDLDDKKPKKQEKK